MTIDRIEASIDRMAERSLAQSQRLERAITHMTEHAPRCYGCNQIVRQILAEMERDLNDARSGGQDAPR